MRSNRKSQWAQFGAKHLGPSSRDFRRTALYGSAGVAAGAAAGGFFPGMKAGLFQGRERRLAEEGRVASKAGKSLEAQQLIEEQGRMVAGLADMGSKEMLGALSRSGFDANNFNIEFRGDRFRFMPKTDVVLTDKMKSELGFLNRKYLDAIEKIKQNYAGELNAQKALAVKEARSLKLGEMGPGAVAGAGAVGSAVLAGTLAAYGAIKAKRAIGKIASKFKSRMRAEQPANQSPVLDRQGVPGNGRKANGGANGNGRKGNGNGVTPARKLGRTGPNRIWWGQGAEASLLQSRLARMGSKAKLSGKQMTRLRTLARDRKIRSVDLRKISGIIGGILAQEKEAAAKKPQEKPADKPPAARPDVYHGLRPMKPKDLTALVEHLGFSYSRSSGDHKIYTHQDGRRATIPMYNHEISGGTFHNIVRRELKMSNEQFNRKREERKL